MMMCFVCLSSSSLSDWLIDWDFAYVLYPSPFMKLSSWHYCFTCISVQTTTTKILLMYLARSYYLGISSPAVFEWPTTPRPLCLSLSLWLNNTPNSPWAIPCSQPTRQSWKPLLRYGSGRRNGTSVGGPTTYYFVSSLHIYDSPFSYPHSLRFKIHFQVLKVTCADSQGVYEQEKSRRRDPRLSDIAGAAVSAYLVQQLLFDVLILTQSSLSHHN